MSARDRILDGAAEVMRTRGLANTTTKEIAKAAGHSEAMLYKVFRSRRRCSPTRGYSRGTGPHIRRFAADVVNALEPVLRNP